MPQPRAPRTVVAVTAILCCSLASPDGAPPPPGTRAAASFQADHGNECTTTNASIEVIDDESPRVVFHWDVFGQPLDPGCDGLWYYFLDGDVPLNPGEFNAHPNRRSATLEKLITVLDGESGSTFDVMVSVVWTAVRGHRLSAEMKIGAPEIGTRWTDDPLSSTTASLVRARRP